MTEQPTALWLADWLDVRACGGSDWNAKMNAAAAELRRLVAQRDALLEALKELVGKNERFTGGVWDRARAVIKKAEEGK